MNSRPPVCSPLDKDVRRKQVATCHSERINIYIDSGMVHSAGQLCKCLDGIRRGVVIDDKAHPLRAAHCSGSADGQIAMCVNDAGVVVGEGCTPLMGYRVNRRHSVCFVACPDCGRSLTQPIVMSCGIYKTWVGGKVPVEHRPCPSVVYVRRVGPHDISL